MKDRLHLLTETDQKLRTIQHGTQRMLDGTRRVPFEELLDQADKVASDAALHEALELVLPFMDNNPRRLKQALNLLRLWSYLAAEWLKPDTAERQADSTEPLLTLKKLAKAVVMELRWPTKLLNLAEQAGRADVEVRVSIEHLSNELPKALLEAGGEAGLLRVCDLRAILSVAAPANRRDSEMEERVMDRAA